MHIALLLYGRIEKFKDNYDRILDVIGKNNTVDIFYSSDYEPPQKIAEFIELYKPVKIVNERIIHANIISKYPNLFDYQNNNRFYSFECQYINKMRVFMLLDEYLKETNITYDLVICTRMDLEFCSVIPTIIPKENTIYIPLESDFEGGINDQFALGTVEVMRKYCNLYKNLIYLLENKLSIAHPENLTKANLVYNNIIIKRFSLMFFVSGRSWR